jgi:predicted nucleotidyltransferase
MHLPRDLIDLLAAFAEESVEAVIVGGYAVAFHARPRATKDLDLLVSGERENLRRAARALRRFGAPPHVADAVERLSEAEVAYFGKPPLRVDILRKVDGVSTQEVLARAVLATWDGVQVRIIARDDLIANKRAVGRPQDLLDAALLEQVAATASPGRKQ